MPASAFTRRAVLAGGAALLASAASRARAAARTILFIGNSFTEGAGSPVRDWGAASVIDINGTGRGGVPALFKRFTEQAGLDWAVSLETQGGKTLGWHYEQRRALLDRRWDVVVLQDYSTLDPQRPGDATAHLRDVGRWATLLRGRNPRVRIELMATWSRADLVYPADKRWSGEPIARMALDLRAAADRAAAAYGVGVIPVGEAWNRAVSTGVADPNPYDGVAFGQLDLWSHDHYHASTAGYYLEALMVFGRVTGVDPRFLGPGEKAADALGLSPAQAVALQRVAHDQLAVEPSSPASRR